MTAPYLYCKNSLPLFRALQLQHYYKNSVVKSNFSVSELIYEKMKNEESLFIYLIQETREVSFADQI